jgi:hypothetical protein
MNFLTISATKNSIKVLIGFQLSDERNFTEGGKKLLTDPKKSAFVLCHNIFHQIV